MAGPLICDVFDHPPMRRGGQLRLSTRGEAGGGTELLTVVVPVGQNHVEIVAVDKSVIIDVAGTRFGRPRERDAEEQSNASALASEIIVAPRSHNEVRDAVVVCVSGSCN